MRTTKPVTCYLFPITCYLFPITCYLICAVTDGTPFLGFLVKSTGIYLQKKAKKRYKARIAGIEHNRKHGLLTELEAGRRAESVTAHLLLARSRNFRNTVLYGRVFGV